MNLSVLSYAKGTTANIGNILKKTTMEVYPLVEWHFLSTLKHWWGQFSSLFTILCYNFADVLSYNIGK